MKKLLVSLVIGVLAISTVACGKSTGVSKSEVAEGSKPESVTVTSLNGSKEEVAVEVPFDPQRVAVLDLAALDILDTLGLESRVVGASTTTIDYLKKYSDNKEIANLGSIKEADMEAVMESEPDVIFIGGRLAESYDALSEIAPVVYLSTDVELGLIESVEKNATTIATMFGLEDQVSDKMKVFDERIATLQKKAADKTALVGMVTSGSFNLMGNNGRCSLIGKEIGFNNLTEDSDTTEERGGRPTGAGSPHGNEASFEIVVSQNPDYIFVLDRDSAIGTEGAQLAKDVMNNELVNTTDAYKNKQIVYLENPAIWYTAEGGIQALDIMLQDIEKEILK